ncbi:hypothetical protein [Aestuariicoccus sp. MJ-SS9]|uniref:hypothetical protein n=1 Tax=Aestuariicoccus sp. MJ-SS9 TaxID=3079855 RepID=UPI00290A2345|nr:hypothetical protein [Aestuariicoccus sp. MJ-SS9]MDU8912510.1 hypothetical protein [Aestuariicoccus sp. MJ-SS9]
MVFKTVTLGALTLAASNAAAEVGGTPADAVCVRNTSPEQHVFVAEAPGGERAVAHLAPGERLCAQGETTDRTGVVSVFENFESFEGCSRLVPVGRTEDMKEYVDFDRCFWSSNSP